MLKRLCLAAIRWYQSKGGSKQLFYLECNFTPTCSEYTYQAIEKYGVFKGIFLGFGRIRRCNQPDCAQKQHDPIP